MVKGDVILRLGNRQLYQTILNSEAALAEKENYCAVPGSVSSRN